MICSSTKMVLSTLTCDCETQEIYAFVINGNLNKIYQYLQ